MIKINLFGINTVTEVNLHDNSGFGMNDAINAEMISFKKFICTGINTSLQLERCMLFLTA